MSSAEILNATPPGLKFMGPTLGLNVDGMAVSGVADEGIHRGPRAACRSAPGQQLAGAAEVVLPHAGRRYPPRDPPAVRSGWSARPSLSTRSTARLIPNPTPCWGPWTAMVDRLAVSMRLRCRAGVAREGRQAPELPVPVLTLRSGASRGGAGMAAKLLSCSARSADIPARSSRATLTGKSQKRSEEYWTNFAKTGDPDGGNLPHWPEFDAARRAYIDLTNAGQVAKEGLRRKVCELILAKAQGQLRSSGGTALNSKESCALRFQDHSPCGNDCPRPWSGRDRDRPESR